MEQSDDTAHKRELDLASNFCIPLYLGTFGYLIIAKSNCKPNFLSYSALELTTNEAYCLLPSEEEKNSSSLLISSRQSCINVAAGAGRDRRRRTPLSAMAAMINGRELPSLDPDEVDRILEKGVENGNDLETAARERP